MTEIINKIEDSGVKYIRYQFTDLYGSLRGLEAPVRLAGKFISDGLGVDGSSVGFLSAEASDMRLQPNPETFLVLPWNNEIGVLTCDLLESDGKPSLMDPRNILKQQLQKLKEMGYYAEVRPELEYYLLEADEEGYYHPADNARYFDLEPFDQFGHLRQHVVEFAEEIGMDVKYAHAECGPAQQEIELGFGEPLATADQTQLLKQAIRLTADEEGLIATFLPKPFSTEAGNGLHVHQRIMKNGKSIFGDEKEITDELRWYVGGLLKHAPALSAFFNPITNSYRRMVPGHEAPVYLSWGVGNRTALVRIPGYESSVRCEFRGADGVANIYLLFALQLAAGIDGIKNKIEPNEPTIDDVCKYTEEERQKKNIQTLPSSLYEALMQMKNSDFIKQTLNDSLINTYLKKKLSEWDTFVSGESSVTDWEFNDFLHYG